MVRPGKRRWFFLLTALAITVAAIVLGPAPAEVVEVAAERAQPGPPASPLQKASLDEGAPVFVDDGDANPFEKRGWEEPPPAAQAAAMIAPVEVAPLALEPEEPKGPPPLPYKYVGRFSDDAGGLVYLARGEQTLVARQGDTIENSYRVMAVEPRRIEFEHIASGAKQTLLVPEAE